ncbi:molybdate ABC transporter substrate-binding protein [Sphingomonas sp. OTU376]|uniref:molybdate ABC transporter substrate-binding protein n=1 Tax=Sphingomonas sp. OTU376 TaxID=3043863 RepID=UPI00313BF275
MTTNPGIDRRALLAGIGAVALARPRTARAAQAPLVLAAASLQESMTAAADAWARKGHVRPVCSFAASSALARQIAAGAAADLFASADEPWMDDIEKRGLIVPGTRTPFLGNRLVIVAPAGAPLARPQDELRALGKTRVAIADPDAVPAGRYAKAALESGGRWAAVETNIVRAESVRAALALVERGVVPRGIVYATDAQASGKVRIAAIFTERSHPPIRYPLARLKASTSPDAEPFRRFLLSGEGKAIFRRFGFRPL